MRAAERRLVAAEPGDAGEQVVVGRPRQERREQRVFMRPRRLDLVLGPQISRHVLWRVAKEMGKKTVIRR